MLSKIPIFTAILCILASWLGPTMELLIECSYVNEHLVADFDFSILSSWQLKMFANTLFTYGAVASAAGFLMGTLVQRLTQHVMNCHHRKRRSPE